MPRHNCDNPTKLTLRVARRFEARLTGQTQKLVALIEAVQKPLRTLNRAVFYYRNSTPEELDALTITLAAASKDLLRMLVLEFENPRMGEKAKTFITRTKNLAKLVQGWAEAKSWAELEPVLKSQSTKAKDVNQKFQEYTQELTNLMEYFDTEQESSMPVGPWSVTLFTAARVDWNQDLGEKLQQVLDGSTRLLSRVGLGKYAGGVVWAYPTRIMPGASGSHSAFASYNPSRDLMRLAVGGDIHEVTHSVIHELGHRVYFKELSGAGRDEWSAFFDSESGPLDVDTLIKAWEDYTHKDNWEAKKYGRYTPYFAGELRKSNPDLLMWLEIIAHKIPDLNKMEKLDPMTGSPKKGSKAGLDLLIENRGKIRAFLHPVSAYSTWSAEEAFAEIFAAYVIEGSGRVPEVVRDIFNRVLPRIRMAAGQGF